MRLYLISLCLLITFNTYAQISTKFLKGNWVKAQIEFKNGDKLTDDIPSKYAYIKYAFINSEEATIRTDYKFRGINLNYYIHGNLLEFKNQAGFLINTFLIEKATSDILILLQKGSTGFEDPNCFRFYFIPETVYQRSIPITSDDILAVKGNDTIFKESAKIYAEYKSDKTFYEYLQENIAEFQNVSSKTDARFVATFIVDPSGKADSLHILEGVNPKFDSQFIRAFKRAGLWQPAVHNGKKVAIQMTQKFSFLSSSTFLPSYDFSDKGKAAMQRHEYELALYFFDQALKNIPDETTNLYNRAICKLALGNKTGACEDLNAVKRLGSAMADELISKTCK